MTTNNDMAQKLDQLPDNFDFNDPNALAAAMGYDGSDADEEGLDGQKGDSNTDDQQQLQISAPATAATAAPAPAVDSATVKQDSETPAAAATEPVEVVGVLTKDGKHTMPYAVLQEARRAASVNKARADEAAAENARLQEQIEALKSGKTTTDGMSDAELDQLREDFPQLAPVLKTVKDLQAQVAASKAPTPRVDASAQIDQELDAQAELDAALAARPLLTRYMAQGGVVWSRAIEIDAALMRDPAFARKSIGERFVDVERRLAEELGIPLRGPADTTPTPKPAAPAVSAEAIANAPAAGPSTLSDITGTAPKVEKDPWDDRSALDGLAAAEKLSDEGLMRLAGLTY